MTRTELSNLIEDKNQARAAELDKITEKQTAELRHAIGEVQEDIRRSNAEQSSERLRLHGENRQTNEGVFKRITDLEKGVSRIEGGLSTGRYQRP